MKILANPIKTKKDWELQRNLAAKDPGEFHGEIAKRMLYWFDKKLNVWLKYEDQNNGWFGFDVAHGYKKHKIDVSKKYKPWRVNFDDSEAPYYQWFLGGKTNACFNEVDAHVLGGFGEEIAFYYEGDRWDPLLNSGKGGPVEQRTLSRKQLLWEVAKCAVALQDLGLKTGDRIVLNMPNILEQIFYIEAAKRLGIIYTCVFGGFSAKTLSDRIHDSGAKVIITTDGAYRNAQVAAFKESFTDKALDDYIPVEWAVDIVSTVLQATKNVEHNYAEQIIDAVKEAVTGEITVERSEVMRGVGNALEKISAWHASDKAHLRSAIAAELVNSPSRVDHVIVVQHTHIADLVWHAQRDVWSHDLLTKAVTKFLSVAERLKYKCGSDIMALMTDQFISVVYSLSTAVPLDSDFPLFIIYTSGSTGKPKGAVHTQGGYLSGIAYTMQIAFDIPANPECNQGQVIYVVADPGWITGQSYMISAALITRTTSIITEGSPLFPHAGRFTSIIERYKVTAFKAGSTFLKTVAADPGNIADVARYDVSSLRVATFCAEPTSPTIQEFAMGLLTKQYINSYWATEHGGIILTNFYGNEDFKLQPDAHTFPLPWIFADVWVPEKIFEIGSSVHSEYRSAGLEEKGEIIITQPYPYLARTLWGDAENIGKSTWRGDIARFKKVYFNNWSKKGSNGKEIILAYTQGDFASKYADGSMTLHGRSDDVINTSGHRIGTEEIEGAILKDKQLNAKSIVGNAIVVGAPHKDKGTVPVAFILTNKGRRLSLEDEQRLTNLVREEKGIVAVPAGFITVSQFPETRSGKYMRRFLRNMLENAPLGDTSTLRNPESLVELEKNIKNWQSKMLLEEDHDLLQLFATLRVENHEIIPGSSIAIVTIDRPPVNTLDERTMDELGTVLDHLEQRKDVKVIIITGAGAKSFVAGADVRQLLEEMHSEKDVLPLSHQAMKIMCAIEHLKKPVIAAINGVALGGGNELQMACHYRVAESTATFGQPEINLHLIPGYGGTQRLYRLLEDKQKNIDALVQAAIIILSGRSLDADEALKIGLINEVVQLEDVVSRSVELAREYILQGSGILATAHKHRLEQLKIWDNTRKFPLDEFNKSVAIEHLTHQAKLVGRSKPLDWALDAIKYGYEHGITKGLEHEAEIFANAVVDPQGGKFGIQAFFDKKSGSLPVKENVELQWARDHEDELLKSRELIKFGSAFYPGVTHIPKYQYGFLVEKDPLTGTPLHGDPIVAERKRVIPVEVPTEVEALLYMISSEINFNDIWAITGVPVSPFDSHDLDWHVSGSGGLALVVEIGHELKKEGRIKVGDLVAVFSGQSQLLAPISGLDPMFADQQIQGYEVPNGSHQQFMIAQGPQIHLKVPDLSLEAAGCYILNLGTIYRALFTTLQIQPGKTIFVEGSSTGTGAEAVKAGVRDKLNVIGLVSSEERADAVMESGAVGTINRSDPALKNIYTLVPEDPTKWQEWEQAGIPMIDMFKEHSGGVLADYVISHAGEVSFPRSFQLIEKNGVLTFFGASSGYQFTFMGKPGKEQPEEMLHRVGLQNGSAVLIYYGLEAGNPADPVGLEIIEACRDLQTKIVVCTQSDIQSNFVKSLGYGDAIKGVFSIVELQRKEGEHFTWPVTMPSLPNPKDATVAFKEAVRWYQENVFKPFASQVGKMLKSPENPKGYPDLVFERAHQDMLCLSSMLVKPYTGKVVFSEDMSGRRYSFYAPQVWMRQRRIYMPTAGIWGTHLSNAYEIQKLNELINAGFLQVGEPFVVNEEELARAHQDMWENKHRASNYLFNHALPRLGLKSKDDLYRAWALRDKDAE